MTDQNQTRNRTSPPQSRRSFLKALLLGYGGWIATGPWVIVHGDAESSADRLLATLKRGGCVVYIRHAQTDRSRDDVLQPDLTNCATQRLLSPAGKKQADELGSALRALGIPLGQIYCSPYCRTLETARRAFPGHALTKVGELGRLGRTITNKVPESCASLKRLLAAKPPPGENTMIVGHSDNLAAVGGPAIEEAGLAIFRPEKDGFTLVGTFDPPQWQALAQTAKDKKPVR